MDYSVPIITDNRRFREQVPAKSAYFEASEKEFKLFPRKNGVVVDPSLIDFCDCSVCGSKTSDQLFVKFGFIYAKCSLCSHVFVRNRLKEDILLKMYSQSVADQLDRQVQRSSQHQEYWGKVYDKYLSYTQRHSTNNRNLLDVGCGSGAFLMHCSNSPDINFDLHAIDFCKDTFEHITKLVGKENYYFQQRLEDIDFGTKKFGLITMWGVLEHVADPIRVMKKCHDILDDSGFVILLIPNLHSRAFKILGINTPTLNPRAHINMYTEGSFAVLCEKTNFAIVDFLQELPVIDLMYPYIVYDKHLIDDIVIKKESYYYVYIIAAKC